MQAEQAESIGVARRHDPRLISFRYSMSMAINRIGVPAPVVFVRDYEGETEAEALARSGAQGGTPQFVHLA